MIVSIQKNPVFSLFSTSLNRSLHTVITNHLYLHRSLSFMFINGRRVNESDAADKKENVFEKEYILLLKKRRVIFI